MEIDEGKLKSLEKCFLWEEMVRWRRKIKVKKKMNSVNGGREVDERWNKKEKKERDKDVRGQNLGPTLKTQPKAELTQSTQKKKKNNNHF